MKRNKDMIRLNPRGNSDTGTAGYEEQQATRMSNETRTLVMELMEKICERNNLNQAYLKVKSNKGASGVDKMTVNDLGPYLRKHKEELIESLLKGSYQPQAIRGVEIPKPGGEKRQLGIPTVVDRVIQQAILQVIEPLFEPTFSEASYGFRPKRSAHQALKAAGKHIAEGNDYVVDLDLEKFFDRVNHDILMSRLARRIGDKRLLKIIRRFLTAGMMCEGICRRREEGTPQGSPLSPLLSNILLDDLDKELERRGHRFCRYADDCNIYVGSYKAGERVKQSIQSYLWKRLKLKLNEEKSAVGMVTERKFLGYTFERDGRMKLAQETVKRVKDKIRKLTKRSRGISLEAMVEELNTYLKGWLNYFKLSWERSKFQSLDGWIHRRIRCYRLKQRKRDRSVASYLISLGVNAKKAYQVAYSSKGLWRLSRAPTVHQALPNRWFTKLGLINLENEYQAKRSIETAVCNKARTVV